MNGMDSVSDDTRRATVGFDQWYRNAYRTVLAVLLADGVDRPAAEDAVADAAVAVLDRWEHVGNPTAYAITVARRASRRTARRTTVPVPVVVADDPDGDVTILSTSTMAFFDAIADLPQRQRDVLTLRHVLDLTEERIGDLLDIRRGTVSVLLRRSYRTLARTLTAP